MRRHRLALLLVIVVVGAVVLGLAHHFPDALASNRGQMSLVYYAVWIVLCAGTIAALFRQPFGIAAKHIGAWALILVAIVGLYAFKDDLRGFGLRVAGQLVPSLAISNAPGEFTVRASADGHFYVDAELNGAPARMMIDTGASSVVLSARAAGRAGIDLDRLRYDSPVSTANGMTWAAPARIVRLSVGPVAIEDVALMVARPGDLEISLLGMSLLRRFAHVSIDGDRLVLRPE